MKHAQINCLQYIQCDFEKKGCHFHVDFKQHNQMRVLQQNHVTLKT